MVKTLLGILVLMLIGTPLWIALGLPPALLMLATGMPDSLIVSRMFAGMDSYLLIAIPLFLWASELMNAGGLTARLLDLASVIFARSRAALAMISLFLNMLMAGISGSALADASAIGRLLIPRMTKEGYTPAFAAAVIACGSVVGPIIPPSISFIIYSVLANASIADLFLAGVVPGILIILCQMATVQWLAWRGHLILPERVTPRDDAPSSRRAVMLRALPVLFLPVIIVGGIRFGLFTATEGAGWAVAYALVLGLWLRQLRLREVGASAVRVARSMGEIMLMIAAAGLLSWVLVAEQIPQAFGTFILSLTENRWLILLLLNAMLLFVGCILETVPAMIIFVPILLPVAESVGIDPIQLGVIINVNLIIGAVTPPVGVLLFITSKIAGVRLESAAVAMVPLLGASLLALMIISYIPAVSLALPGLLR